MPSLNDEPVHFVFKAVGVATQSWVDALQVSSMHASRRPDRSQLAGETLQIMQRLWDLVHALDVRSKRMAKLLGVTGPQRLVIRMLGQAPDSTASDVAAMLGLHPSTLTGILKRLESEAIITRAVDAADRRRAMFRLTTKGKRIDSQRRGTVEAAVRRALTRTKQPDVQTAMALFESLARELVRRA